MENINESKIPDPLKIAETKPIHKGGSKNWQKTIGQCH